jgi:hypothetical protein
VQRDVAVRVDDAWQDKLARGVDGAIVRAYRRHRFFGMADMADPVSLDDNERICDRVAPGSVDQRPVLDQQPRRGIGHESPPVTLDREVRV